MAAKLLGENKIRDAHELFSFLAIVSILGGLVVAGLGLLLVRPLAILLGATDELLDLSILYGSILMAGIPCFLLQSAFESLFATAGKPQVGLGFIVAAGLTNFALDALFIIVFGWGLAGAAIATVLGQTVGGVLPLVYFRSSKTTLLKLIKPRALFGKLGGVCLNGSSELVGVASTSIVSMLYNYQLMTYVGADGVAAYGIITYLALVFAAVYFGYTMGSAPLISYQHGARNETELKNLFKKSVITMFALGVILTALAHLLAGPIADLFVNGNAHVKELTMHGFALFNWVFLIMGFNLFASALFTALGNGKVSASPQLDAEHPDAALIHEAAIGKIAGEQLLKLRTLGLTEEEAEQKIISGFFSLMTFPISSIGIRLPISLLVCITETRIVSSRRAALSSSGLTTPSSFTGR